MIQELQVNQMLLSSSLNFFY